MSYDRFCRLYPLPHGTEHFSKHYSPAKSKSLKRSIWLVTLIFAASMFALVASAAMGAPVDPLDAVVMVRSAKGGGSGVVISPAGDVLTAEHVIAGGEEFSITYRGRKFAAKLLRDPQRNGIDEAALLQFEAGQVSYLPVAKSAPQVGDFVYTFGFPGLAYYSAQIAEVKGIGTNGETIINAWCIEGNSGGPLLNAAGEVVGLCSSRFPLPDNDKDPNNQPGLVPGSVWVSWQSIQAAVNRAVEPSVKPAQQSGGLMYFSASWCGPCRQMAPIVNRLKREGLPIQKVDVDKQVYLAKLYGVKSVPTFVLVDADKREIERLVGLQNESTLRKMIAGAPESYRRTPAKIEDLFTPRVQPPKIEFGEAPKLEPPKIEFGEPQPAEQIDWSLVKIVVLRSNPDLGDKTSAVLAALKDRLGGPFRRRLQELTGGKADVELVHQQLHPDRFAAVQSAIGREAGSLLVVVLTKQQDLGLIKGTIASQVQSSLEGYIEGKVPVEIVSQRVHPADYAAVESALSTVESDPPADDAPWWIAGLASVVGMVVGYVLNLIQRRRKAKAE